MINKLFVILKYSGIITITFLNVRTIRADTTEYVFSAPPEVDNEVVEEIPEQETEYPFYECEKEAENKTEEGLRDSHDCVCVDCEDEVGETQDDENLGERSLNK